MCVCVRVYIKDCWAKGIWCLSLQMFVLLPYMIILASPPHFKAVWKGLFRDHDQPPCHILLNVVDSLKIFSFSTTLARSHWDKSKLPGEAEKSSMVDHFMDREGISTELGDIILLTKIITLLFYSFDHGQCNGHNVHLMASHCWWSNPRGEHLLMHMQ